MYFFLVVVKTDWYTILPVFLFISSNLFGSSNIVFIGPGVQSWLIYLRAQCLGSPYLFYACSRSTGFCSRFSTRVSSSDAMEKTASERSDAKHNASSFHSCFPCFCNINTCARLLEQLSALGYHLFEPFSRVEPTVASTLLHSMAFFGVTLLTLCCLHLASYYLCGGSWVPLKRCHFRFLSYIVFCLMPFFLRCICVRQC